jgi:hypothetical protein
MMRLTFILNAFTIIYIYIYICRLCIEGAKGLLYTSTKLVFMAYIVVSSRRVYHDQAPRAPTIMGKS